jgi:hypothetical protein
MAPTALSRTPPPSRVSQFAAALWWWLVHAHAAWVRRRLRSLAPGQPATGDRVGPDVAALLAAVEERFDVPTPNAGPARLSTVGDLYRHVLKYTPSNWPRPVTGRLPDSLWEYVVDVVQYETGLPRERLTRGARFVQDLGLH